MPTPYVRAVPGAELDPLSLSNFCSELLVSLPRSDQRRWGVTYVDGLISVPGRKSIRRIARAAGRGDAVQSLQQFVNQSPWAWEPVRRSLARRVQREAPARAWVVREITFPKYGHDSVAVAKQYLPSERRVVNCQRALCLFLAGDAGSIPVNWRLMLPICWNNDVRRIKTRVPDEERNKPNWLHALDLIDEAVTDWRLPPAPVVVTPNDTSDVCPLLAGLAARKLSHLVRVPGATRLRVASAVAPGRVRELTAAQLAAQLTASVVDRGVKPLLRCDRGTNVGTTAQVSLVCDSDGPGRTAPDGSVARTVSRPRRVLTEWSAGPGGTAGKGTVWLPGLESGARPATLLCARRRTAEDQARLIDELGLNHFEGRSYPGWHHHVTLASVAHGYRQLRQLRQLRG